MTDKVSPTLKVLREIRDRVETLERQMAVQNDRTDQLVAQNKQMVAQSILLSTEVAAVASAVIEVRDLLADRLDQRDRVDDHERRLQRLERKAS